MRVVVTGGAGFIGANLVRHLRTTGTADEVTVIDDLSTGFEHNLDGSGAELVVGSILDSAMLDAVIEGAHAIVHLAARPSVPRSLEDPEASNEVNVTGTLRVLEAARRAGGTYTLVASSSSVYGATTTLPKHEDLRPQPLSPYAVSKLAAESYSLVYARCFGLPVLVFRFFNVFGPLQPAGHAYAAALPAFVSAAMHGKPLTVFGDGKQTRDFTYVGTVAEVLGDAIRRRVTHEGPVNLAFGSNHALLDVIEVLERVFGRRLDVVYSDARRGDVRDSQADQERLRALFPDASPVELEDGLRATVDWFRETAGV